MAVEKRFLRQQILAQLDRCTALAYAAGQHFLQHGEHALASMQAQAEADARLIHLIEDYAALPVAMPRTIEFTQADGSKPVIGVVLAQPKHVCGEQGYNGMIDPPCPACEANRSGNAGVPASEPPCDPFKTHCARCNNNNNDRCPPDGVASVDGSCDAG